MILNGILGRTTANTFSFNVLGQKDRKEESSRIPRKEALMKKEEKNPAKRSVKFDENVDTMLITNRLERLRREMELEDDRETERRSQIRNGYHGYLDRLNQQHRQIEKELRGKAKVRLMDAFRKQDATMLWRQH